MLHEFKTSEATAREFWNQVQRHHLKIPAIFPNCKDLMLTSSAREYIGAHVMLALGGVGDIARYSDHQELVVIEKGELTNEVIDEFRLSFIPNEISDKVFLRLLGQDLLTFFKGCGSPMQMHPGHSVFVRFETSGDNVVAYLKPAEKPPPVGNRALVIE